MKDVLIFDNYLAGKRSTSYDVNIPLNHRWIHSSTNHYNEIAHLVSRDCVVYTDDCIMMHEKVGKRRVAWMLEPMEYAPIYFNYIKKSYQQFDIVFTWDKRLLDISDRFMFYPPANSWIKRDEIGIYQKIN